MIAPIMLGNATEFNLEALKKFERVKRTIETFLTGNNYINGDTMTLADIFLWCVVESGSRIDPLDVEKSKNTIEWLEKMRQHSSNEFQQQGASMLDAFIKRRLTENKKASNEN